VRNTVSTPLCEAVNGWASLDVRARLDAGAGRMRIMSGSQSLTALDSKHSLSVRVFICVNRRFGEGMCPQSEVRHDKTYQKLISK